MRKLFLGGLAILSLVAAAGFASFTGKTATGDTPASPVQTSFSVGSLRFIGEQRIAFGTKYNSTAVGGLSSIDYNGNQFYIMCDDPADSNAVRFYTATIGVTATVLSAPVFTSVVTIKRPDGLDFPKRSVSRTEAADPEGICIDQVNGTLYWTSEGYRTTNTAAPTGLLAQPFIREMTLTGVYVRDLAVPTIFNNDTTQTTSGGRGNGSFETVRISASGEIWTANEVPLYGDGGTSTNTSRGVVRVVKYNNVTGQPSAQYAYQLDSLVPVPNPAGSFSVHGAVDIQPLTDTTMLVMERGFAVGASPDYNLRIYEASISGADDVNAVAGINSATVKFMSKRLVLDFETIRSQLINARLDNIEGMCFGPTLANGNRTLIVVSDDNFGASQVTQFLAFEVTEATSAAPANESVSPRGFALAQNYPNPFNPATVISYQVPVAGEVKLKIFDVLGREVATLVNTKQAAGTYSVSFNAAGLTSGTYLYKLEAGNYSETKKMLLVK
ncbi:MAG: esterase-like activity of phytase family protein [Rhizobacter sp.]|nr:esterase-like activity of phytase family protein [Chlorobiales bacterium]